MEDNPALLPLLLIEERVWKLGDSGRDAVLGGAITGGTNLYPGHLLEQRFTESLQLLVISPPQAPVPWTQPPQLSPPLDGPL